LATSVEAASADFIPMAAPVASEKDTVIAARNPRKPDTDLRISFAP
jgi:hypothetical protein